MAYTTRSRDIYSYRPAALFRLYTAVPQSGHELQQATLTSSQTTTIFFLLCHHIRVSHHMADTTEHADRAGAGAQSDGSKPANRKSGQPLGISGRDVEKVDSEEVPVQAVTTTRTQKILLFSA